MAVYTPVSRPSLKPANPTDKPKLIFLVDPPHIIDYDIHMLWDLFIEAAKGYGKDNTKQNQFALQVLYVREMGTLTCGDQRMVAQASNGQKIWSDLPWFEEDFCIAWADEKMSVDQRSNLASLMARLAAVGVGGNCFTGAALTLFRNVLETADSATQNKQEVSTYDPLPFVATWLFYCPHKLRFLALKSVKNFRSEDAALGPLAIKAGVVNEGFSVLRWEFWTKRIVELGQSKDEKVAELAASLVDTMDMDDYRPV